MKLNTHSGKRVDPTRMKLSDIDIEDIAHGLSNLCRFSGQCPEFYSVSQHSLHVSYILELWGFGPIIQLIGLLHDASEAYLVDIPTMLKKKLPTYKRWERNLQAKVYQKYINVRITKRIAKLIKKADIEALEYELNHFFTNKSITRKHTPKETKRIFLYRFKELTK